MNTDAIFYLAILVVGAVGVVLIEMLPAYLLVLNLVYRQF